VAGRGNDGRRIARDAHPSRRLVLRSLKRKHDGVFDRCGVQGDAGMSMAHPGVGGDGQGGHQPGSRQHRSDPKAYSPGHRDLLHLVRPAIWDHWWFGAAAAADGYRIAG